MPTFRSTQRQEMLFCDDVCLTTRCYTTSHFHQVFFQFRSDFLAFFARISYFKFLEFISCDIKFSCYNFRLSSFFVAILERSMSFFEEYLWRSSKDGFRPQCYYHYRGDKSFHREGFCRKIYSLLSLIITRLWFEKFTRTNFNKFCILYQAPKVSNS